MAKSTGEAWLRLATQRSATLAGRVQWLIDFGFSGDQEPSAEPGSGSVNAAAKRWGVSRGALRAILGGNAKGAPRLDTLERIAARSGADLGWLATGRGEPLTADAIAADPNERPTPSGLRLWAIVKRLSSGGQAQPGSLPLWLMLAPRSIFDAAMTANVWASAGGAADTDARIWNAASEAYGAMADAWASVMEELIEVHGVEAIRAAFAEPYVSRRARFGFHPFGRHLVEQAEARHVVGDDRLLDEQADAYHEFVIKFLTGLGIDVDAAVAERTAPAPSPIRAAYRSGLKPIRGPSNATS